MHQSLLLLKIYLKNVGFWKIRFWAFSFFYICDSHISYMYFQIDFFIRLDVQDVNDNAPDFKNLPYGASVREVCPVCLMLNPWKILLRYVPVTDLLCHISSLNYHKLRPLLNSPISQILRIREQLRLTI